MGLTGSLFAATIALSAWPRRWRHGAKHRVSSDTACELELCIAVVIALITSTLTWSHYYCWLLLRAAILVGSIQHPSEGALRRVMAWTAVFLGLPPVLLLHVEDEALLQVYSRFAVSHHLAGGLLMLAVLLMTRWSCEAQPLSAEEGTCPPSDSGGEACKDPPRWPGW
jgi:hypothetical protein